MLKASTLLQKVSQLSPGENVGEGANAHQAGDVWDEKPLRHAPDRPQPAGGTEKVSHLSHARARVQNQESSSQSSLLRDTLLPPTRARVTFGTVASGDTQAASETAVQETIAWLTVRLKMRPQRVADMVYDWVGSRDGTNGRFIADLNAARWTLKVEAFVGQDEDAMLGHWQKIYYFCHFCQRHACLRCGQLRRSPWLSPSRSAFCFLSESTFEKEGGFATW